MICDFLKIKSYIKAPSLNSPNYYKLQRLSPLPIFKFFMSNLIRNNLIKISTNLSRALFSFPYGQLRTMSSSLLIPILSFRPVLLPF